jgi:hypothetical protein
MSKIAIFATVALLTGQIAAAPAFDYDAVQQGGAYA